MSDTNSIFSEIPDFKYDSESLRPVSREAFENILHNRRSVRVYTDEKVPEEVMQKVLDYALMAPNSSNLQPWEFFWVRSAVKKEALVKACFSQPAARTAQEIIVCVAKIKTWPKIRSLMLDQLKDENGFPKRGTDYYKTLVPLVYTQGYFSILGFLKSVFYFIAGFFRVVPREPVSRNDMKIWATKSTSLAAQNIMMGLAALGYDSCPMEGLDSKRVKKILGLGRNSIIVMAISVGKRDPKKGVYGSRIRMPREEFVKIV
jgi:nitroreductase